MTWAMTLEESTIVDLVGKRPSHWRGNFGQETGSSARQHRAQPFDDIPVLREPSACGRRRPKARRGRSGRSRTRGLAGLAVRARHARSAPRPGGSCRFPLRRGSPGAAVPGLRPDPALRARLRHEVIAPYQRRLGRRSGRRVPPPRACASAPVSMSATEKFLVELLGVRLGFDARSRCSTVTQCWY